MPSPSLPPRSSCDHPFDKQIGRQLVHLTLTIVATMYSLAVVHGTLRNPQYHCISYLLLHNTLPQNLGVENNKPLLSHSFCGLGICTWLGWDHQLGPLTSCSRGVGLAAVLLRFDLGKDLLPKSLTGLLAGFSSCGLAAGCRLVLPCGLLLRAAHSTG